MLPQDPVMLLSVINTKLRDEFDSLDELCAVMDADRNDICERIAAVGYQYDPTQNQFI
ncbi:MAG: DUF4250 domain-containing protein [Eubacteriales bacterium]|nr:DUF4250 domain-containing protein [Eubacteriales bacterium]